MVSGSLISIALVSGSFVHPGVMAMIWIGLTIILVIAELISLGLTSIWFAAGALVAAFAAILGAPFWLQMIVFIIVSVILLASTRKFAKRYLENRIVKTNAESLIGKTSIVQETIDNAVPTGKIRIGDVEWTARTLQEGQVIPQGSRVVIREIAGVKCMVEPAEEEEIPKETKEN